MNEYTSYLLADIADAHRTLNFDEKDDEQTIEDHFAEIENYLNGFDSGPTFSDHCGLESQFFPPADFFSDQELKLICNEFSKMMLTYNLTINYPVNVPISLVYKVIVKTLDTQTSITNHGMLHFDYCSGYAPVCFWKEFCPCLEIWNRPDENLDDDLLNGF